MSAATVTGRIRGGRNGWAFGAATRDLALEGYVEEEYFLEGEAPRYRGLGEFGHDGCWMAERAGSSPFKTRLVVRRPLDAARFNGTVVVEWNNVSSGFEVFEAGDSSVIFDEGFAYVGATVQRVGAHGFDDMPELGLRAWDPVRYESLELCDDAISYGVFTVVGRAVSPSRPTSPVDPLGGLPVRRLIATGASQSAVRLATYINAVHPIEHVFDGYLLAVWAGHGASLDDPGTMDIYAEDAASRVLVHLTHIRSDLEAPVMVVNSEFETLVSYPVRQADTDRFRFWEIAGAPHAPLLNMERMLPKMMRDMVQPPAPPGQPIDPAALVPVSWAPVQDAAISHLQRWITGGAPPPTQPRIEVAGDPPAILRDDDGNAIGGVRLPEMEATLTCNVGASEVLGLAGLTGTATPLPTEVVRARYPDLDSYLAAFGTAADASVGAGVLRRREADEAVERARIAKLP
jgi:Alpha/beta hydrolase domain